MECEDRRGRCLRLRRAGVQARLQRELKNALDYPHAEWQCKPVALAGWSGVTAGARAVQAVKRVATALKMTPVNEAVSIPLVQIPLVQQLLDQRGDFVPNEPLSAAASAMSDEPLRVGEALRLLRTD